MSECRWDDEASVSSVTKICAEITQSSKGKKNRCGIKHSLVKKEQVFLDSWIPG